MRGFSTRRLSPMVAVEGTAIDGTKYMQALAIGGSGLLEASLEVRLAVNEDWVVALFNDWGLVTPEPLFASANFFASLYTAVGVGVRYRTPLGPIRLDLAFRFPFVGGPLPVPDTVEPNGGCFFGLGRTGSRTYAGAPENLCALHVSVGEAF
jgi:translocation and assembly module TamA